MRISELQTSEVMSVTPTQSIDAAITLMEERGVHHLPVVSDGRAVGMLSDRDLLLSVGWKLAIERRTSASGDVAGPLRVDQIMSTPVVTIGPDADIADAARIMVERKIGALPIVRHERLLGLVTENDLLLWLRAGDLDADLERLLSRPVHEHMRTRVVSVTPDSALHDVVRTLRENHCRHVPVLAGGVLVGILSDRDVRRAMGESAINDAQAQRRGRFYLGPLAVREIMITPVRTLDSSRSLSTAVKHMVSHLVHALPIVDHDELVGMLTATDVLRAIATSQEVGAA